MPEELRRRYYDRCIRIPMRPDARSLNLANSVAILAYEALRQQGFPAAVRSGGDGTEPVSSRFLKAFLSGERSQRNEL